MAIHLFRTLERNVSICVALLTMIGIYADQHSQVMGAKPNTAEHAEMIDRLANENEAPQLTKQPSGRVPSFSENYDWQEQDRVKDALREIHENMSSDLWEELVKHANDPRYSLTVMDQSQQAENRSVGYLCRQIAFSCLVSPFRRHLVATDDPTKEGRKIHLDVDVEPPRLYEWRRKRERKSLYELQIEVCEIAIARINENPGINSEQKGMMRSRILGETEKLRDTKRPVFPPGRMLELDTYSRPPASRVNAGRISGDRSQ
jgi:hypothetical protein